MEIFHTTEMSPEVRRNRLLNNLIVVDASIMVGVTGTLLSWGVGWWWIFLLITLAIFAVLCFIEES